MINLVDLSYNKSTSYSKAVLRFTTQKPRVSHNRIFCALCALSVKPLAVGSSGIAGRAQLV